MLGEVIFQHVSEKISSHIWLLFQIKAHLSSHHSNICGTHCVFKGVRLILRCIQLKYYKEENRL